MFDNFLTKCVQPKTVSWEAPDKMMIQEDEVAKEYEILKGAMNYIHKNINIKVPTSKEVYKKANNIWIELRDLLLQQCKDSENNMIKFDLESNTMLYLTTDAGELVDVKEFNSKEDVNKFKDRHQKFNIDLTTMNTCKKFFQDCKGGLIKFICYDKNANVETEDYTPIIIMEMNNEKSVYKVYLGIMIYKQFVFIPADLCYIDSENLFDFICDFDMEYYLEEAKKIAPDLYDRYLNYEQNPIEISAREVTALFKKVGYKLQLDDVDKLYPIEQISDEENNQKIQDFYNTFKFTTGETAYDILKLSDFRKTFRYNAMTLLDILKILSKEYLSYDGGKITIEILWSIVDKLNNVNSVDRIQVEMIEKEQNK